MKDGYIYVYKCIVGSHDDICKIGKTIHYDDYSDRLVQHQRTLYYGFVPYTEFITGKPIATYFYVRDYNKSEQIIKEHLKDKQLSSLEIYNVPYEELCDKIYRILSEEKLLIKFIGDKYTKYNFIKDSDTTKKEFEKIRDKIENKYKDKYPESLISMLKDKKEFEKNCKSHHESGNWIVFKNGMVLDLHYSKAVRVEIKNKLNNILLDGDSDV